MAKILGLDLGTNSIGWAVVEKNNKIIDTGVRIFPEGVEPTTIGSGDKEQSKNASRRDNRQIRRQNYRTRLRRIKLLETLIDYKMCPLTKDTLKIWKKYDKTKGKEGKKFPDTPEFIQWLKQNPYELRAKAINEDINHEQLGRIFYHLIQRRGFLSNRKGKDDGKIFKGKNKITGIDDTKKQIENTTLGSFLYSIYPKENKPYKEITDEVGKPLRIRSRYTLRDMYIAEFEKIWQRQAEHLGLNNKTAKFKKERFLKGSINTKRNKQKIEYLRKKYGEENFIIDGSKITTYQYIPLKKYLAGEINFEDGIIKHKSQESILFYQRPLRSQKGLLAKCSLEGRKFYDKKNKKWIIIGPTPCPRSHPEFEEYRALQYINNIEYGTKHKLDEFQTQIVLNLINKKDANFDFTLIPKEIKLTSERFNYDDKQKVPGNYTHTKLKSLFSDEVWKKHKEDIWHCFYFFEDNDKLIKKLHKDYGLKEADFSKIEKINLKDKYSDISLKAIRNILPFMRKEFDVLQDKHIKNSEAIFLGGVKNAFGKRWEYFKNSYDEIIKITIDIIRNKNNKEGEAIEKVKEYLSNPENHFGFIKNDKNFKKLYHHSQEVEKHNLEHKLPEIENLRNPIVQQGVNELRRLINNLITKYSKTDPDFKFDQIKVELARNLRTGKKQRQNATIRMYKNNEKNEIARQKLTESGLRHSRENIQKYLLFDEIQNKNGIVNCPYTGKTININDLLGKENKFQIEHIFPKSISLDDSFGNKTLCDAKFNGLKGNKTPYQFYIENKDKNLWGASSWEQIEHRAFRLLPYNKAKRFTSKEKDLDKNEFIERQLNDTRYISKKAKEILTQICDDVRVMPGNLTSELRHLWGLNNVLQPVEVLNTSGSIIDEDKPKPHWAILNENNQVINFLPVFKNKPNLEKNETTVLGEVKKEIFSSKYFNIKITTPKLKEGKYWSKLKLSESSVKMIKMFADKPETKEDKIVLRGNIEKGYFENKTIGKKIKTNEENGKYWAIFTVLNAKFEKPEKRKQPTKKINQILLYGNVKDGIFKSYIYECNTNMTDGRYWILLNVDFEHIEYLNTENKKPNIDEQKIIINGTINEDGLFSSEIDAEHTFKTDNEAGKYWAVFEILSISKELYPVENNKPEITNEQKLLEGNIWVDKQTGEIKYDPKKNRNDHRHHAIDAIAIALTKQSYLQKLSTYNANKDEKYRGNKYDKPQFDEPWENFYCDVKQAASNILISFKQNNHVLTKISKTVVKNGKKYKSKGYSARGQLHKEFVYGAKKRALKDEYGKIIFGKNHKIKVETDKNGDIVYYYHIRNKLEDIKTKTRVEKIVDDEIKKLIEKQINDLGGYTGNKKDKVPSEAFFKTIDNIKVPQISLPNKKGGEKVPVKKVRIKEIISNAVKLKNINQWVNPRNNHHIAIYENKNRELFEKVVTLWEAVDRKKQGLSVIDKKPTDGSKFIESLEKNEMFILGLSDEEFENNKYNQQFFNKYLYRVQKFSTTGYKIVFRRHIASTILNDKEMIGISDIKKWKEKRYNPIKVKISPTGKITKIEK